MKIHFAGYARGGTIRNVLLTALIMFNATLHAGYPNEGNQELTNGMSGYSGVRETRGLVSAEHYEAMPYDNRRTIQGMHMPVLVAAKGWAFIPELKIMVFPPISGNIEQDREERLTGVFWYFMPFMLPEAGGTIDRIIITGQNNNGNGADVNLGFGVWNAAQPTGTDNYGKLGSLLYSGTKVVKDNANGQNILASGMNVIASQQEIWVGVACQFGQTWNIQGVQSVAYPGLNGVSGHKAYPGVYGVKLQFGHDTPPPEGSVVTLGGPPFSIYISWTKP